MLLKAAAGISLLSSIMAADSFEVRYGVSFWFFGQIGVTTLHLQRNATDYKIEAHARLQGIAAAIAHHHTEYHVSEGQIGADGRLIPRQYRVYKTLDHYRNHRSYRFDYRLKRITQAFMQERNVTSHHFDPRRLGMTKQQETQHKTWQRIESFWAEDDLLTLYFNGRSALRGLRLAQTVSLHAVGARHGDVRVRRTGRFTFDVLLDQEIFKTKDGKLFVQSDENFYVEKAIIKDVVLFGDLEVAYEKMQWSPKAPAN